MTPPPHPRTYPPTTVEKLYNWLDAEIDVIDRADQHTVVNDHVFHRNQTLHEVRDKLDEILTEPTPACPDCHLVPIIWDEQYGTVCRCQFCGAMVQVDGKGNLTRVVK